ncbi:MAG: hypothetical protein V1733_00525 [bacterium]
MKRIVVLSGLILAFFFFSAKKCEDGVQANQEQEEAVLAATVDSIRNGLTTDYLSGDAIRSFEKLAEQKLRDYADYFSIASDTSLDTAFRAQAEGMTGELFCPGRTPGELLPGAEIRIDSIRLVEPMHLTGAAGYKGMLGFREEIRRITGQEPIAGASVWKRIEILATKSKKPVGTDTLEIWKIYLGEIY